MTRIEIGTPVIHTRYAGTFIYDGEHEAGPTWTAIVANMRGNYTGILSPVSDVAPAGVDVRESSPRVTAEKVPSVLPHGPRTVWQASIDGIPAVRHARTRKDAVTEALRTMAVRDFHNDYVTAGARRVLELEGV